MRSWSCPVRSDFWCYTLLRTRALKLCSYSQALTIQLASAVAYNSHSAAAVQLASSALSMAETHVISGTLASEPTDGGRVLINKASDKRLTGRAASSSSTPVLKLLMELVCRMDSHQSPGQMTGRGAGQAAGQVARADTLSAAEACILQALRTCQMDDISRQSPLESSAL